MDLGLDSFCGRYTAKIDDEYRGSYPQINLSWSTSDLPKKSSEKSDHYRERISLVAPLRPADG